MCPRLYFDENKNKWAIEYGMIPKYIRYFETEEEAKQSWNDILLEHDNACAAFRCVASYLAEIGGRHLA